MSFGRRYALARTRHTIGEVNEAKAQLGFRLEFQTCKRLEIAIVTAIPRHRHMDQLNAALDVGAKAVCEVDHIAHIDRLNDMPVVGVAVAEVEEKLDIGRHMIRKVRENCRK